MSELLYNWYCSPGQYPPTSEKEHNALNMYAYLKNQGWTIEAIAGAAGNFEIESRFNPGLFEGRVYTEWPSNDFALRVVRGFGLAQWTPANTKYMEWAINTMDADYRNGWLQLYRLTLTKGLWVRGNVGGMTFQQYTQSTQSPEQLSRIWCKAYERPASPDYASRATAARTYYTLFAGTPQSELPTPPVDPVHPDDPQPIPPPGPEPGPGPDPSRVQIPLWMLFKFQRGREQF